MKPRLLDLFCGAGGAAMGYSRAGFEVVGVDINPQPNYPFEFIQGDALDPAWVSYSDRGEVFDAIHASPPCQRYSSMSNCRPGLSETYPDLVGPVRGLLEATGLPYVIENVPRSPVRPDLILCGCMFGMRSRRPRWFESNIGLGVAPLHSHGSPAFNPQNVKGRKRIREEFGAGDPDKMWRKDVGVEWMTRAEGRESIPPAYTEFIGTQLLTFLDSLSGAAEEGEA